MNGQQIRKKSDQLNEFLREDLMKFVAVPNGPPLWQQVKEASHRGLMKAIEAGLIDSNQLERIEPTITIAKSVPDDGTVNINVLYRFS